MRRATTVERLTWMSSDEVRRYAPAVYWMASGTGFDMHEEQSKVSGLRQGEPIIRIRYYGDPAKAFDENGRWLGDWCKEDVDRWLAWDATLRLG